MKEQMLKIAKDLEQGTITETEAQNLLLGLFGVSGSCSCGVKYVKTKKSDIPYDTDGNVHENAKSCTQKNQYVHKNPKSCT